MCHVLAGIAQTVWGSSFMCVVCGFLGLFRGVEAHPTPMGRVALGGCAGSPGSDVCVSAVHVMTRQCIG